MKKEEQDKYARKLFPFVLVFGILMYFILNSPNKNSTTIYEDMESNYKNEISGIVSSAHCYNRVITFRLKGKVDYPYYFSITRNDKMSPSYLDEFVLRGDSVYKAPNTDSLFVIRGDKRHLFVLNKTIN